MKQKIQLQIPEPCHENWNNMTTTQHGRFCMSCQKEVIDFSIMTDKEILNYISTASKNICGRVANDQLNRHLTMPQEPRTIWWKYWMSIAASFIILSSKSNAQVKAIKSPVVCQPQKLTGDTVVRRVVGKMLAKIEINKEQIEINGRVVDAKANPVPYASINLKNSHIGVAADSLGNFKLILNEDLLNIELSISSAGYESKTIILSKAENIKSMKLKGNGFQIEIKDVALAQQQMKEVVIRAHELCTRMAGGLMWGIKVSYIEKAKADFKDTLGINEVKIYPNPVSANHLFNINFNLKDQGEYTIRFIDASGKMIYGKTVNILSKNHVESFDGNVFKSHGIYFATVTNKQNNKMYTTKLLVQ